MDVTIEERASLLNIILVDSATCLEKRGEVPLTNSGKAWSCRSLARCNSTVPQSPRGFQIVVLGPEAEESLDGGARRPITAH